MTAERRVLLTSAFRCPACGVTQLIQMPTTACQFFLECPNCHTLVRPRPGDCCVFCSYGSVPCPPRQANPGDDDCKSR